MCNNTEVINIYKHPDKDYVYIGRGSPFGNPFKLGKYTREEALEKFHHYFHEYALKNEDYRNAVLALKGKKLGCFCKPKSCHGDIIKEWLDGQANTV
uniref:DUF4326 domain-containing protein n=1 Tax=viral metagenome TaxID=1070528 RepID=A0A6M3L3D3_9ZZZZ